MGGKKRSAKNRTQSGSKGKLGQLYSTLSSELQRDLDREVEDLDPRTTISTFTHLCTSAFRAAVEIAKLSRNDSGPRNPGAFLVQFLSLDVALSRLKKHFPDQTLPPAGWPRNPGTTFSWKAGDSAAMVALRFADMIHGAAQIARAHHFPLGPMEKGQHAWELATTTDERIHLWCEATILEMRDHTLPRIPDWPMWKIHRDTEALLSLLRDEHERADSKDTVESALKAPPLCAACGRPAFESHSCVEREILQSLQDNGPSNWRCVASRIERGYESTRAAGARLVTRSLVRKHGAGRRTSFSVTERGLAAL